MATAISSKLFWPTHCINVKPGFLVGWNVRGFIASIATIVSDVELSALEDVLKKISTDPNMQAISGHCKGSPVVIGEWQADFPLSTTEEIAARKQTANIWLTMRLDRHNCPSLREVWCCGYRYRTSAQVIFYKQPDPAHNLSTEALDIGKLLMQSLTGANVSSPLEPTDMDYILRQINASAEVENALYVALSRLPKSLLNSTTDVTEQDADMPEANSESTGVLNRRKKDKPTENIILAQYDASINPNPTGSTLPLPLPLPAGGPSMGGPPGLSPSSPMSIASSVSKWTQHLPLPPSKQTKRNACSSFPSLFARFMLRFMMFIMLLVRWSSIPLMWILNISIPSLGRVGDLFCFRAVARQLDIRTREAREWPRQYGILRTTRMNNPNTLATFLRLYGSLALAVLDLLAGIVGILLLRYQTELILTMVHQLGKVLHVDVLRSEINWLMGLPAGFKLNVNLDQFLGSVILNLIDLWNEITTILTPLEPYIVKWIGWSGLFGLSVQLSVASDVLTLCTLHVYYIYLSIARLYSLQLTVLSSLWKLFRGKKRNVLRHRIDHCNYDTDQLLLGTLLFTLFFFLFPTTSMYYICFVLIWLVVVLVQAVIWGSLTFLNHFPLFLLMVFASDPGRLSGGVVLEVYPKPNASGVSEILHPQSQSLFGALFSAVKSVFATVKNLMLGRSIGSLSDENADGADAVPTASHDGPAVPVGNSPILPSPSLSLPLPPANPYPFGSSPSNSPMSGTPLASPAPASGSANTGSARATMRRPVKIETTYMFLHNRMVALPSLFVEYQHALAATMTHFSPGKIVNCLFFGDTLPAYTLPKLGDRSAYEPYTSLRTYLDHIKKLLML
eukprot:GILK01007321.1.p1 GENE.GILK01007321.1~~GILK01007321.1.p1  ORF type:complete len:860 (-),score=120.70 GILK01007321.1:263-2803(-)